MTKVLHCKQTPVAVTVVRLELLSRPLSKLVLQQHRCVLVPGKQQQVAAPRVYLAEEHRKVLHHFKKSALKKSAMSTAKKSITREDSV